MAPLRCSHPARATGVVSPIVACRSHAGAPAPPVMAGPIMSAPPSLPHGYQQTRHSNLGWKHLEFIEILIMDVETQPDRHVVLEGTKSCPDLVSIASDLDLGPKASKSAPDAIIVYNWSNAGMLRSLQYHDHCSCPWN
ncbi:hypothetical protein GUJ93_ZPchr0002g23663 [Zizania palustris]|uniref:Uncharacterized protein n=1 Tax=Zizania palustris TaxID=103762 RepID=A0A8J5RX44_ZIZPA|nr:hypothetical protein GUJ93_ZPchr0002g23663 [Zizania palustris]